MKLEQIIRENSGPPVNIEAIIRSLGIQLDKKAELHDDISGQIERISDNNYRISVNNNNHYYRQRFTMAHELGHYLYHFDLLGDGVDDNTAYRSVPNGRFYNQNIGSREETEANRFAASILMPETLVRHVWNSKKSVSETARTFQVSSHAMEIRLRGLEVDGI